MALRFPSITRLRRECTPVVLQAQANECGLASLGIILGYFGRHTSLNELRATSGISRAGLTGVGLVQLARKYGIEAKGYRYQIAELSELPLPAILSFRFNHFVVLEKVRRDHFIVNDPISGPRGIPIEQFREDFTGVVFTCRPVPALERARPKFRTARQIARLLHPFRLLVLIAVLACWLEWIGPLLLARGILTLAGGATQQALGWIAGAAATSVATAVMSAASLARFRTRLNLAGPEMLLRQALKFSSGFFIYRLPSTVCALIESYQGIGETLCDCGAAFLRALPIPVMLVVIMIWSPPVTILTASFLAIRILISCALYTPRDGAYRTWVHEGGETAGLDAWDIREIERLKLGDRPAAAFCSITGAQAVSLSAHQAFRGRTTIHSSIQTAMLLLVGLYAVANWQPANVAAAALAIWCMVQLDCACACWPGYEAMRSLLMRLDDLPDAAGCEPCDTTPGIAARDVSFGYDLGEPPILSGVSFELAPGRITGLAGRPGTGRSTIARLLCGLLEPWAGEIHTGGSDPALVEDWQAFFAGTVRDNITLLDPAIPDSAIADALKITCAYDLIAHRGGFDCPMVAGGTNFSGGERQRLAIARALVRRPGVLVLDEATDALDPELETRVLANIRTAGCACLVISLRPSSLALCDEVLVCAHGSIVERGVPESLQRLGGEFAHLMQTVPVHG